MYDDLHSALRSEVLGTTTLTSAAVSLVKLQYTKDRHSYSIHVRPSGWSTAGIQMTDFLVLLGFVRSNCPFQAPECYVRRVDEWFDLPRFAESFAGAWESLRNADSSLAECGIHIEHPEGFGFFLGRSSAPHISRSVRAQGDGHSAAKKEQLKTSEDAYFRFVLSWIDGRDGKGWIMHYRPIHPPLSREMESALEFLGSFASFGECPEFDFEPCRWRFVEYEEGRSYHDRNTSYVHQCFDRHSLRFSAGLELLLRSHRLLLPFGFSFLEEAGPVAPEPDPGQLARLSDRGGRGQAFEYDVAISFAGPQRHLAEAIGRHARDAGLRVFLDSFFPEQLWGRDLAVFFDEVYRKKSRYCVILISKDYAAREWTSHERRSAQARAIKEKGGEYILPVRVDDTELDGLQPTMGYVSLGQVTAEEIAALIAKKVSG